MNANEIWDALNMLAEHQGFYGRLCQQLEASGQKDEILKEWEQHHFKDIVDLILFIESE